MRALFAPWLLAFCAPTLASQDERTLPENCPYCEGRPKAMESAGITSHGPFPFGVNDSTAAQALVPSAEIYWIESEHFRLGFGAGSAKVTSRQSKKVRAELERLKLVLPSVKPKSKILQPWLRVHLYAQRFEDAYAQFLELMEVKQSDFPTGESQWMIGEPYWGEGPYLGEEDKFEVLVLLNAEQQVDYLSAQFGLQIRHTQKWNILNRGCLTVVTNILEEGMQNDAKLHGSLVFNLLHNFIDGFKYYTYETPYWLSEGLAHYVERRLSTRFNTYSRSEGSTPLEKGAKNWTAEVKSMISRDEAPRLAELMGIKSYSDFDLEDHYTTWSMVSFLIESQPAAFAKLNRQIHGRKKADGSPDGSNISDAFRELFKQTIGMSYAAFDRKWAAWALEQETKH